MTDRLIGRRNVRRGMMAAGCAAVLLSSCTVRSVDGEASPRSDDVTQSTADDATASTADSGAEQGSTPDSSSPEPTTPGETTPPTSSGTPESEATSPPTTIALPRTCDEFSDASAYQRMLAVAEGAAPSDSQCADAVADATAANRVFQKGRELSSDYGVGEWQENRSSLFPGLGCEGGSTGSEVVNTFDAPIVVWGAAYVVGAGNSGDIEVLDTQLFVSDVLEPGSTTVLEVDLDLGGDVENDCIFDTRVFVAPTGDLAADAGLVPIDSDDAQSSDDAAVWLPALRSIEDDFGSNPSPDTLVANIEDVHSPDVWTVLGAIEGDPGGDPPDPDSVDFRQTATTTATTVPEPPEVASVCSISDVTEGRDTTGELALVVFTSSTAFVGFHQALGMFRRGSDGRWRYVGRTVELPTTPTDGDLCDGAPTLAP